MTEHDEKANQKALEEADAQAMPTRRAVIQAAIGAGALAATLSTLYVGAGLIPRRVKTPQNEPPQVGDLLVYATGPRLKQPILAADLPLGGPFQLAFPMDPKTRVVRDQETENTVLLLRLNPSGYLPAVAAQAAEGIICYSATCTHLGCTVSLWDAGQQNLRCPCHGAQYDPRADRVVGGPAPRPLTLLPIRLEGGQVAVAGAFLGPVGVQV